MNDFPFLQVFLSWSEWGINLSTIYPSLIRPPAAFFPPAALACPALFSPFLRRRRKWSEFSEPFDRVVVIPSSRFISKIAKDTVVNRTKEITKGKRRRVV